MNAVLANAIALARSGDNQKAQQALQQIVTTSPGNFHAWVWLAHVVPTVEEKRTALIKAVALAPQDRRLRAVLQSLNTPQEVRRVAHNGVFIGYARSDELFAIDLSESLRAAGVKVWLDTLDMPNDMTWNSGVVGALRTCGIMLMIVSPAAMESESLQTEERFFSERGKIVIPLIAQPCDYAKYNFWHTPVDFHTDYELGLRQLLKLLDVVQQAGHQG